MISKQKNRLSTKSAVALSTTTTLFYKKKIRRQDKCLGKTKMLLPLGTTLCLLIK